jgi:hypothetical protein
MLIIILMAPTSEGKGRKEGIYVYTLCIYIYIWKRNQSFLSSCSPWSLISSHIQIDLL